MGRVKGGGGARLGAKEREGWVFERERVNSSEEEVEEGEDEKRKFWDAGLNSTQKTSYFFQVPELFYKTDTSQS